MNSGDSQDIELVLKNTRFRRFNDSTMLGPSIPGADPATVIPESGQHLLGRLDVLSSDSGSSSWTRAMPLTHGTTFDNLESILNIGKLLPRHCSVFGDTLTYLFYGRFAYRVEMDDNVNSLNNDGPVALIFKHDVAAGHPPKRIFPFDSGGYEKYYKVALGNKEVGDYQLVNLNHVQHILQACWASREGYFWFDPDRLVNVNSIPVAKRHWRMYIGMLHGVSIQGGDDRRGTVEFSTENGIPVDNSTLIGLVIPRKFFSNPKIVELKASGIKIEAYPHFGGLPGHQYGVIRERAFKICVESGYFTAEPEDGV